MSQMRKFAELYASGDATIPRRRETLLAHRQSLRARQADLERCRTILDRKLQKYDETVKDQS